MEGPVQPPGGTERLFVRGRSCIMRMSGRHSIATRKIWLGVAVLAVLAIVFESSGLDLIVMDALYRAGGNDYVLRDAWWTKRLLHDGGQDVIRTIALAAVLVSVFGTWSPGLQRHRRAACYVFLAISLSALIAGIGKSTTNIACTGGLCGSTSQFRD